LCLLVSASSAQTCVGDCNGNNEVTINELILGVNIALGNQPITACEAFDCQGTGMVPINCLIQGVNNASNGCPPVGPTNTPTTGPSDTPTETPTEGPTLTPTETPEPGVCNLKPGTCMGGANNGQDCTATAQCPGGMCNTSGDISKVEINVAAIPVPLAFPIRGRVRVSPTGTGTERPFECIIENIDPINIPNIGFVCITPSDDPCSPGTIDCDGGPDLLGIDVLSDGNIGNCQSNAACETACDAYCATSGGARQTVGCTGYCSGSTPQQCTADTQCGDVNNGACNGPDPVGNTADICQCQCLNTAAGEATQPGDFQCELGASLVVESAAPCDGSDVAIQVGDACIPLTSVTATGKITNSNFNQMPCPGGGPPCMVPAGGAIMNSGNPVSCDAYTTGPLTGLKAVGVVNFFGSALGDLATELFSVCK
jgi:hypothetical protein